MLVCRFQTPLVATLISGLLTALLAALLDLQSLVDMMSIGTLLAYMIVSLCVIILHYRPAVGLPEETEPEQCEDLQQALLETETRTKWFATVFNLHGKTTPDHVTFSLCVRLVLLFFLAAAVLALLLGRFLPRILELPVLLPLATALFLSFLALFCLALQPRNSERAAFTVPLVPFLPALSVFINLYLMSKLSLATWIRFLAWLLVGLAIYGGYGVRHSTEEEREQAREEPQDQADYGTIVY